MAIYEFSNNGIIPLNSTTFGAQNLRERDDLQRHLRESIEVIAPGTLVIAEEFGDWEESRRRIDLLGLDKAANLVVIELKRTEDGGHMELQSIRYAAMVSTMTFEKAADIYDRFLKMHKLDYDPRAKILEFLGWEEPNEEQFAQDVKIVLASAEFSKELTSSVLWLLDHGIDIRCVRLKPYTLSNYVLVDVQQIIPLPDTFEYQIQLREKARTEREARTSSRDYTKFDVTLENKSYHSQNKRIAIYLIVKYLCTKGVKPEDISKIISWRQGRIWLSMPGTLNATEFQQQAAAAAKEKNSKHNFDRNRWFCQEDELIHTDERTIAFSNQWGRRTQEAMTLLKQIYGSQYEFDFQLIDGN